jgi:outer membrane receptor protein involved in Fe transport
MNHLALRAVFCALLLALLSGVATAGVTGKIRGRIADKATGEPLVGASIVVETTTMGASADVNGEFTILNVPPGVYSVRANYVGYRTVITRQVHVSVDLTTEVKFALESEAIVGQAVEIIAQAPLVNKSATNKVDIITAEQIEKLPVRDVRAVFGLTAGVVQQGGNYYVRGGRLEETAFYVDGVLVNNPINGQMTLNLINNAIEEVQSQTGGMTAQYGNAMSGLVNATTRLGGPSYSGSLEIITDQLGGEHKKNVFGAYSYGQSEYAATFGGPIPGTSSIRFFVAGQRVFNRSGASFLNGVDYPINADSLAITGSDWRIVDRFATQGNTQTVAAGTTGHRTYLANLLNSVNYQGGRSLNGINQDSYAFNGNVYGDFGTASFKLGGTYNHNIGINSWGGGTGALGMTQVYSGLARPFVTTSTDASAYVKFTQFLNPVTYYTLQANYYGYKFTTEDQTFRDNIWAYGDPAQNPVLVGPSKNPPAWSLYSFSVSWPGAMPTTSYQKGVRESWGGRLDFTRQFGQTWELRAGGELNYYTIRSYYVAAFYLALAKAQNPTGSDWSIYNTAGYGGYGYDLYGNEFAGGSFTDKSGTSVDLTEDGPRHPTFLGAYLQNKFEFEDLIINAGLRYDYFDPGAPQWLDPANITVESLNGFPVVAPTSFKAVREKYTQFSPRLGLSFPVADRSVFHATYGRFMQMPRLSDLYNYRTDAGYFVGSVYFYVQPNPNLRPERTTDYEVGLRQQLGEQSSVDVTFFYKDTRDLTVIRNVSQVAGSVVVMYINGDYGTSKGFTLTYQMRRTNRLAMNANYTLSSAISTGSSSGTHRDIAWQDDSFEGRPYFPVIPSPTDFDRTHTGNVNLDYRFDKDDGPELFGAKILERFGVDLLMTFSSGVRYTKSQINGAFSFSSINAPYAYEGQNASTGPWIYQLDLKVDKSFTLFNNMDVNVYLWVTNLLNRKNVSNGLYSGTGQPDNDGWLGTSAGQTWVGNNGPDAATLYTYLMDNLNNYGTPRQVRLGVRLGL